ncbi:IQ domain-containing protein IQM2-like [Phoenix dactylifera]|uniref:IQ domain-containing protein IQM2-like n=1 Tax=Phoenix dactylifera TaxID=42345 RepID=A0A8B7MRS7_PHODC|nr:IQ domain-containing protein IQM2-like [Phoenix dactylifera]
MGIPFSCPGADYAALDESFEALFMRSLSLADNVRSTLRSVSFNGRDSQPTILKTFGSGKLIIEGSLSFNRRERRDTFHLETKFSMKSPTSKKESTTRLVDSKKPRFNNLQEKAPESPVIVPDRPKHEAAVKLQKVYKSFRTRRQLADCAVLIEQRWWKLLDFALLKRSSVSFFDIEKPESAVSRWSRARTKAAKVGKGLSKNEKAQKLALQHWLEAIDPRHRYGHNLHFYYDCWLHCESRQPFFYWLDVGDGKEVSLKEHCPRSKLQQQCIKYLGPKEREAYEVIIEDGKFVYRKSRQILDTSEGTKDAKWIFVLSTSKSLYVGQKQKGTFQHSSFLAGGATSAAGRLVVEKGTLKAVWPHSGHYRPTEENFQEFMNYLKENKVDLTDVNLSPTEGDDEFLNRLRSNRSLKLAANPESAAQSSHGSDGTARKAVVTESANSSKTFGGWSAISYLAEFKLGADILAKKSLIFDLYHKLQKQIIFRDPEDSDEESDEEINCTADQKRSVSDGDDQAVEDSSASEQQYMFRKQNLFAEEQEEDEDASVPQELILRRINSKKGMKSYQLGKQLSCKWTTGAGPRIGWVRDYPSELQFRALEQVNLSPREAAPSRFAFPRNITCQSPRLPEASSPKEESQQQPQKPVSDR